MKMQAFLLSIYSALCGGATQGLGLLAAEREVLTTVDESSMAQAVISGVFDWLLKLVMTLIYTICRWAMNIIDFFQYFAYKLIGIDIAGDEILSTSSPLLRFLLSEPVLKAFTWVLIAAIVLLIGFTILAIIRSEYKTATNGEDNSASKSRIYKRVIKALGAMVMFPMVLLAVIILVNAILASVLKAFNANPRATVGSNIFIASAYNANNYRNYANANARIPILIDFEDPEMHTLAHASSYSEEEYEEIYKAWEETGKGLYTQFALNSFSSFGDTIYYKNNIIHNKTDYSGFEKFVCTPEQYQVMADFVDYAVSNNLTFYIKAYDDADIDWKYVNTSIYNPDTKTFEIQYRNSTGKIGDDEQYTIIYQAEEFDFATPMQATIETVNQILSIGNYDEYKFKMLERVDDEKNLVDWKTFKVNAKLSPDYATNPTSLDQLLLYEYYRKAQDHTFKDNILNDLESDGVDLKVMILHNTRYSPSLRQYVEYNKNYVCEINDSYYKLVENEEIINGIKTTVYRFDEEALGNAKYMTSTGVVSGYVPVYVDPANPTEEELIDVVKISALGVDVKLPTNEWGQAELYRDFRVDFNRGDVKYNQVYTPEVPGADLGDGKRIYVDTLEDVCVTGTWTEKIYNDLKVIYKDININTLINTDQWLSAFNEMYNAQSYITTDSASTATATFNTTLIHPLGLIQSELFLGDVEEGQYFNSYADFLYSSSYNDTVIKGLFISMLGEENYHQAYQQYKVYMDLFNCMMSSVLDEVAFYEFFDIVNEANQSIQLYTYKAYLSSVLMSTDVGNYLYNIADTIMNSNNILDYLMDKETDKNGNVTSFTVYNYNDLLKSQEIAKSIIIYWCEKITGKATANTLIVNGHEINGNELISENKIIKDFLIDEVRDLYDNPNLTDTAAFTDINSLYDYWLESSTSAYSQLSDDEKSEYSNSVLKDGISDYNQKHKTMYPSIINYIVDTDGAIIKNDVTDSEGNVTQKVEDALNAVVFGVEQLILNYQATEKMAKTFEVVSDYWEDEQTELETDIEFLDSFRQYMSPEGFRRSWAMGTQSLTRKSEALTILKQMIYTFDKKFPFVSFNTEYLQGAIDYAEVINSTSKEPKQKEEAFKKIKSYLENNLIVVDDIENFDCRTFITIIRDDEEILTNLDYENKYDEAVNFKTSIEILQYLSETYFPNIIKKQITINGIARWFAVANINVNRFKLYSYFKQFMDTLDILNQEGSVDLPTISFISAYAFKDNRPQLRAKVQNIIDIISKEARFLKDPITGLDNDLWSTVLGGIGGDYAQINNALDIENGRFFEVCYQSIDKNGNVIDENNENVNLLCKLWNHLRLIAVDGDLTKAELKELEDEANGPDGRQALNIIDARRIIKDYVSALLMLDAIEVYGVYEAVTSYCSEVLNNTLEITINGRTYVANVNMSSGKFAEYILGYDKLVEYGFNPVYIEDTYQGILSTTQLKFNGETLTTDDTWAHMKKFLNKFGQSCIDLSNKSTLARLEDNKVDNFVLDLYSTNVNLDNTEIHLSTQLANLLIDNLSMDILKTIISKDVNTRENVKTKISEIKNPLGGGTIAFREKVIDLLDYIGLTKEFVAHVNSIDTTDESFTGFTLSEYKRAGLKLLYDYEPYAEDSSYDNQQRYITLVYLVCSDWRCTTGNAVIKWQKSEGILRLDDWYADACGLVLEKDAYSVGLLMRMCGLENRDESELVGLEFTVDLTQQVKSEENGDVFIICTYNEAEERFYPFLMANNTLDDLEKNEDYLNFIHSNGYATPVTTYYGGKSDGKTVCGQWYPVVAKGVINEKGHPTTIKQKDGQIEFYRDDVRIVNASKLGITTYFSDTSMMVAKSGAVSLLANSITKALTGKTLTETALSIIPRIAIESKLHFAYGTEQKSVAKVEAGRMTLDYNFSKSHGVPMNCLFGVEKLNVIVLVFGTIFLFKALWNMIWGLITRIVEVTALSVISPAVFSTIAFTDEKVNKDQAEDIPWIYENWFETIKGKILSVLGFAIGINIFFILAPIINQFYLFSSAEAFKGLVFARMIDVNVLNYIVQVIMLICAITCIQTAPQLINSFAGVKEDLESTGVATRESVNNIDSMVREYTSGRNIVNAKNKAIGLLQASIPGYALGAELMSKYRLSKAKRDANRAQKNTFDSLSGGYAKTSKDVRNAGLSRVKGDKRALRQQLKNGSISRATYDAQMSALKGDAKTIRKQYRSYVKNDLKTDQANHLAGLPDGGLTRKQAQKVSKGVGQAIYRNQYAEEQRRAARRKAYRDAAFPSDKKKKK